MRSKLDLKACELLSGLTVAFSLASCADSAITLPSSPGAVADASSRTIMPKYPSFSNPTVTTDRSTKEYYFDLEECRAQASRVMGGSGSDDVDALRRAIKAQVDAASVVVRYQASDRAVVRDRAVRFCLVRKGYKLQL